MGFGVWGLGFGVWGLGFGVWGLGFGVWGLGFGVEAMAGFTSGRLQVHSKTCTEECLTAAKRPKLPELKPGCPVIPFFFTGAYKGTYTPQKKGMRWNKGTAEHPSKPESSTPSQPIGRLDLAAILIRTHACSHVKKGVGFRD